jgi:hypothetical protein
MSRRWTHHSLLFLLVIVAAACARGSAGGGTSALIHDPVLRVSVQCVLPLATGLLALMALKPGRVGALIIMGVTLLAGIATALPNGLRARGARRAPAHDSHCGKTLT